MAMGRGMENIKALWPTDMYYATLAANDNVWTDSWPTNTLNSYYPANSNYIGDGKFDQDTAPALTDVAIGRLILHAPAGAYHSPSAINRQTPKWHRSKLTLPKTISTAPANGPSSTKR